MPNYTPNINLVKPLGSENYDISKVTNDNADILDTQVASKAPINNPTFTGTVSGITKAMVGLGNVDNTSDANKPVSTAQQNALDLKAPLASPTFIGTATAPTINATSSLQINGSSVQEQLNTKQLKNWIINGGFDVWQRGTSQSTAGYGSDDRWYNHVSGSTLTHSRQAFIIGQTEVPNNPTYFSRSVVVSGNSAGAMVFKAQRVEDVTKLAGKTISVSFWAKADTNKNLSIDFTQTFGTGGSTKVESIGVQKFALTSSWQKFTKVVSIPSVVGKTIGTGSLLQFRFWFDAGSSLNALTDSLGNQSGTFDIANVSLVEGSVPVEWQTEAYEDVLRQCQRYYFRWENNESFAKVLCVFQAYGTDSAWGKILDLPIPMRIAPSVSYVGTFIPTNAAGYSTTAFTYMTSVHTTKTSIATGGWGGSSGLVAGNATTITANQGSYVEVSAEL